MTVSRTTGAGVLRAGALSMLAIGALGATRLVHGSLVSHATDRATFGLVGTLLGVTVIASFALPGGVASAAAKFVALHRGAGDLAAARAAHRYLRRLGMAAAVLLAAGTALAARPIFDIGYADTIAVALLTWSYSLYSVDKASLYGFGRVAPYAMLELAASAAAVCATVLVVVVGWRAYLLPLALGYALFVVGARVILRPDVHGGVGAGIDRAEMRGYIALASVGAVSGAGFLQGTQLIAFWLTEPAQVAYVAAAVVLVAPLYFLPRALGLALFPAMAGAHGAGDVEAVRRHADVSTRALVALLAPVFAAGAFCAPEVLRLFGGAAYADGAGELRWILAATFLAVIAVPAVNSLSSGEHRYVRVPTLAAVCGCLAGLGVAIALGGPLGGHGVGIGYLLGTAVTAGCPMVVAWRRHGLAWAGPLARAGAVVVAAFVVAAVVDAAAVDSAGAGVGAAAAVDVAAAAGAALVAVVVLRGDLRLLATAARRRPIQPT